MDGAWIHEGNASDALPYPWIAVCFFQCEDGAGLCHEQWSLEGIAAAGRDVAMASESRMNPVVAFLRFPVHTLWCTGGKCHAGSAALVGPVVFFDAGYPEFAQSGAGVPSVAGVADGCEVFFQFVYREPVFIKYRVALQLALGGIPGLRAGVGGEHAGACRAGHAVDGVVRPDIGG